MGQRLALIGTFYHRPTLIPRIAAALREQTRPPDECWLLYEDEADGLALLSESWPGTARVMHVPVPPGVIAPCFQINVALDAITTDFVTYLTDDSLPHPEKYERLMAALVEHDAVYCGQDFGTVGSAEAWLEAGWGGGARNATEPEPNPFCRVDHTQVAHRRSDDRWPTGLDALHNSDGEFFRRLVARYGPLQPVPAVLDWTRQMPDGISAR